MRTLIVLTFLLAFAAPASAQWADPGGTWPAADPTVAATLAAQPGTDTLPAPPAEEPNVTGEDAGAGTPEPLVAAQATAPDTTPVGAPAPVTIPADTVTRPPVPEPPAPTPRPAVPEPPAPSPRPGIPCTVYTPQHCPPGFTPTS